MEEGHVSDTETSPLLPPEQNKETEKYRTLKEAYFTDFRKYKTYKLEERPYKTRIDRKIDECDSLYSGNNCFATSRKIKGD